MKYLLTIDRHQCYYPGCRGKAEQWHHVWPRCVTKQKQSDLRGAVPACRRHHALATAESTLIQAASVCWEATTTGHKKLPSLIHLYLSGWPLVRLSSRFSISTTTVRNALIRSGIQMRTCSEARKGKPLPQQRVFSGRQAKALCQEYEDGYSIRELAKYHQCGKETIRQTIQRAGGVLRNRSLSQIARQRLKGQRRKTR